MGKTIVKMFKGNNRYKDENAVENLVNYVYDHPEDNLIDGINISSDRDMAIMQMKKLKKLQRNTEGRQAVHFIVSNWMFNRIPAGNLLSIGRKIAEIFQNKYQILLVVHAPTAGGSRHLHFVINTVSLSGRKLHMNWKEFEAFRNEIETIVDECLYGYYGLYK